MLRRLLACLALLTGLAAVGAPASAQQVAPHAAQAAAVSAALHVDTHTVPRASAMVGVFKQAPRVIAAPVAAGGRAVQPGVRIGIDRARI